MAKLLKSVEVNAALNEKILEKSSKLIEEGIKPCLAIVRVGERPDDLSYERGAMKRCDALNVVVKQYLLDVSVTQEELLAVIDEINNDKNIHGCLMFRPLPKHLNEKEICEALDPAKDVDSITVGSLAGVFVNQPLGFSPCTAQAVMEILHHYGIDTVGKKAVVIGRSLVIGRPVAMLLMHDNATVTICHTKTVDMPSITKEADIVVVAAGKMETIGAEYFREGQTVIDVGIGWNDAKGKLCGDVIFDEVEPVVDAITPVPGGVGGVTTSVLVSHVVEAAARQSKINL